MFLQGLQMITCARKIASILVFVKKRQESQYFYQIKIHLPPVNLYVAIVFGTGQESNGLLGFT